ncbi:antitoxin [Saccharopolyspora sp. HNM0983]|uniref:Antitoxin n=1 Tax=Saccharopolyspora montiporae TaxID=2781240 RepID=A0A929B655_9PSEU|nr:antitoxin [Saccharopolyspora sp. HNM0983]MBE9373934.1 antitoxin [Saccharopolyspora sp. HNM0983]
MSFLDKAKDLANQAKGKAEELADKHGPTAAKGVDAAKSQLDKATGGKYHDKIEGVNSKVQDALNRDQQNGEPGRDGDKGGPEDKDRNDGGSDGTGPKSS